MLLVNLEKSGSLTNSTIYKASLNGNYPEALESYITSWLLKSTNKSDIVII